VTLGEADNARVMAKKATPGQFVALLAFFAVVFIAALVSDSPDDVRAHAPILIGLGAVVGALLMGGTFVAERRWPNMATWSKQAGLGVVLFLGVVVSHLLKSASPAWRVASSGLFLGMVFAFLAKMLYERAKGTSALPAPPSPPLPPPPAS